MKLKVVNGQEKDKVYVISCAAPELNVPDVPEGKTLLVRKKQELAKAGAA